MHIIPFIEATGELPAQMAAILTDAFTAFASGWKNHAEARAEVESFRSGDRAAFLAIDAGQVAGWIGAIMHSQHLWELHPLAVHPERQSKGIGRALVRHLEAEAQRRGVTTIWLGSDDDFGGTSLYGKDLYPDVIGHLRTLQSTGNHPLEFYRSLGYTVVGVIPDASGSGKHDILMAKRIA